MRKIIFQEIGYFLCSVSHCLALSLLMSQPVKYGKNLWTALLVWPWIYYSPSAGGCKHHLLGHWVKMFSCKLEERMKGEPEWKSWKKKIQLIFNKCLSQFWRTSIQVFFLFVCFFKFFFFLSFPSCIQYLAGKNMLLHISMFQIPRESWIEMLYTNTTILSLHLSSLHKQK